MVEVLITITIIAVLAALLMPIMSLVRTASQSVTCRHNLQCLSAAFQLYAHNNNGRLPYPAFTEIPWERSILPYANATAFVCPGDAELAPTTNSSYDWRDTGSSNTTMAGTIWGNNTRSNAVFVFDVLPGWHTPSQMNAIRLDGSCQSIAPQDCVTDLNTPIR